MALKDKCIVRLDSEQRRELEALAATGRRSAAAIIRARILLKADANTDSWTDERIVEAMDTSATTVARLGVGMPARIDMPTQSGGHGTGAMP